MQHNIGITVINSPVGVPTPTDGVMMLFMQGVAVASELVLDTPYLITQPSDAAVYGINAAYDVTNSTAVFQQINEFYNEAGAGALLWIVVVAMNTAYTAYVASQPFADHIVFTAAAVPANRAKMIGLCYAPPSAVQTGGDFPADVLSAITALQTAQANLFALGYQFSGIIDGYNMSSTVTMANIGTMIGYSAQSVSLCITGTLGNGVSGVGLCLGRFARISIGHGLGCVADGPRNTATAYLTNGINVAAGTNVVTGNVYTVVGGAITYNGVTYQPGTTFTAIAGHATFTTTAGGYAIQNSTPVQALRPTDVNQLGAKQFLFLRTWMNHSGFYWNDGATCEDPTLQLSTQEYNRVANNLSAAALSFFIDQIGKNEPLDVSTGAVAQTVLNALEAQFYTEFIGPLSVANGSGDITDGALILSGPNFNTTKTMSFRIEIEPTPIMGGATGVIEFVATL